MLVEGIRASAEALAAGAPVSFVVTSPRLATSDAGAALEAGLSGLDVHEVEDDELDALADTRSPQGILLVCGEPEAGLEGIRAGGRYLVLDGVQDPGNAGTLLRGAVAFGLDGVVCLDGTVDPWAAKTVRASAGMVFRMPVVLADARDLATRSTSAGVPLLAADALGEDVEPLAGMESFALVVGNEGAGVRPELRRAAEKVVAVWTPGPAESLNVGMAGSILLYTLTRGATA